jgi:mono/diheme cytochrome c family protein
VSLTRNTVRTALAALGAVAIALAIGACGRNDPDLETGKAKFVGKCGSCHTLGRAATQGTTGPNLDTSFQAALHDGMDRDTVKGIVRKQIAHPALGSGMPAGLVSGEDAGDVAAYVAYATGKKGDDTGALAPAGLAQAKTGPQIFTAAGCAGCHTFGPANSNGTIGPNLNQLKTEAGNMEKGKTADQYVRESIEDPSAFIVKGFPNAMPSFKGRLSDAQIKALIDFLLQKGG